MKRPDVQQTLRWLATEPLLQRVTSALPQAALPEIAGELASSDPYHEAKFLRSALAQMESLSSVASVYSHQLWCAWREAQWRTGRLTGKPLDMSVNGWEWFKETRGHPTAMLIPMTLGLFDALEVLRQLSDTRPFILYGEGMLAEDLPDVLGEFPFAGEGQAAVRKITTVLGQGGLFYTYPDFVYSNHSILPVQLFGATRPISAGYVSLIAKPGTLILPAIALHDGDGFAIHCREPFQVPVCPDRKWRSVFRQQLAEQCAREIEALIRLDPAQWLLLNTLTFDSPQLADAHRNVPTERAGK